MIAAQYLQGVKWVPFEPLPGVCFAHDYRDPTGASRVLATYNKGRAGKSAIFAWMRRLANQVETPGDWDFHHIVEAQDYADVDFTGRLTRGYESDFYLRQMPCVLIDSRPRVGEHRMFNASLHTAAAAEHFKNRGPGDIPARSRRAVARAANPAEHLRLRSEVVRLRDELYRWTYEGDPVLQQISHNVFTEALTLLHRVSVAAPIPH